MKEAREPGAFVADPSAGFLQVHRIKVPRSIAIDIQEFLRSRGRLGVEAVGFWAGTHAGEVFDVLAAVIPDQRAASAAEGLAVVIESESLFDMNVLLHEHRWTLIAQIHSHLGEAYHSNTDDDYSVMTRLGGLSIVVPDFARGPVDPGEWATYRLDDRGRWQLLTPAKAVELITLVD